MKQLELYTTHLSMDKQWIVETVDKTDDWILDNKVLPITFQSLLQTRGITANNLKGYLYPSIQKQHSPFLLKGIDIAIKRFIKAIENHEKILIYGDYDVDGLTAIALFNNFFKLLNFPFDYYLPHRVKEGYGLSKEGIEYAKKKEITLLITVDTGISAVKQVEIANQENIDVIITDHHKAPQILPPALAILNPNQPDCNYPNKFLSGVGVAYKFIHALLKKTNCDEIKAKEFLKESLEWVTLGTIADVVPLVEENRNIVHYGLKKIRNTKVTALQTLIEKSFENNQDIDSTSISYKVAPKLNASGRTDHGKKTAQFLIEPQRALSRLLYEQLVEMNKERKEFERCDFEIAKKIYENNESKSPYFTVVISEKFHPGVNGIVASRLCERYGKPAIVFVKDNDDLWKGSARSIKTLNIFSILEQCKELLEKFGGHKFAAGMTIKEKNLPIFSEKLQILTSPHFSHKKPIPFIKIDSCINLAEITSSFLSLIQKMQPFGQNNEPPIFLSKNVSFMEKPKLLNQLHLKGTLSQDTIFFDCIGFNLADKWQKIPRHTDSIDIVYRIEKNFWKNRETIQLNLLDIRKHHSHVG